MTAHRSSSTASSSLVRNAGRCFGSIPARSFSPDVQPGQQRQGDRRPTPGGRRAARGRPRRGRRRRATPAGPGVGLWWTPAPWTCGPYRSVGVSSRASVSRSAPATSGLTTSRARRAAMQVGPLAGGRDGGVARAELAAQPGGPDPAGDGPPAAGQDGPEEQQGEPRGGPGVEGGRRGGKTTGTGRGAGARMSWPAPSGAAGWCGNRHRPGRAGPRLHGRSAAQLQEVAESTGPETVTGS